jgi:hypothetical protein
VAEAPVSFGELGVDQQDLHLATSSTATSTKTLRTTSSDLRGKLDGGGAKTTQGAVTAPETSDPRLRASRYFAKPSRTSE